MTSIHTYTFYNANKSSHSSAATPSRGKKNTVKPYVDIFVDPDTSKDAVQKAIGKTKLNARVPLANNISLGNNAPLVSLRQPDEPAQMSQADPLWEDAENYHHYTYHMTPVRATNTWLAPSLP